METQKNTQTTTISEYEEFDRYVNDLHEMVERMDKEDLKTFLVASLTDFRYTAEERDILLTRVLRLREYVNNWINHPPRLVSDKMAYEVVCQAMLDQVESTLDELEILRNRIK